MSYGDLNEDNFGRGNEQQNYNAEKELGGDPWRRSKAWSDETDLACLRKLSHQESMSLFHGSNWIFDSIADFISSNVPTMRGRV